MEEKVLNPSSLLDLSFVVADEHLQSLTSRDISPYDVTPRDENIDEAHSCGWKRFLPVLYKGFRLHLHAVIDLAIGLMENIANQKFLDVVKRNKDEGLQYYYQSLASCNKGIGDSRLGDFRGTLADSRGTLADSRGTLADSRGTLADSRGTLADSRGPLTDSRGTLADSRGVLAQNSCCLRCESDWMKTAHALDNHVSTATKRMNFETLKVLNHYGFIDIHYNTFNTPIFAKDCVEGFRLKAKKGCDTKEMCATLDYLIDEIGYNVNYMDENSDTLIHFVVQHKHFDADFLEYVISKGAKCDVPNLAGDTPLTTIPRIVTAQNGIDGTFVYDVPKNRENILGKLQVLLQNGANLETPDSHGRTPLQNALIYCNMAYMNNQIGVIKLLVRHGCIVNNDKIVRQVINLTEFFDYAGHMVEFFNLFYHAGFNYRYMFRKIQNLNQCHLIDKQCHCQKCKHLNFYRTAMSPLVGICRQNIRNQLRNVKNGYSITTRVELLEIPAILKSYLNMDPKTEFAPWATGVPLS